MLRHISVILQTTMLIGIASLPVFLPTAPADAKGKFSVLYDFSGTEAGWPNGGLIQDKQGNLYGTTVLGGANYDGTVFKLAPDGTQTILHSFTGNDGEAPSGGVIMDAQGNLFGATTFGGSADEGVVYELSPKGKLKILHSFAGGSDGAEPGAAVTLDSAGNLYGTTAWGGGGAACGGGCGVVYRIAPDGTETVLHAFQGGADGQLPQAGVILDNAGNLFGTTEWGGNGASCGGPSGCGTVYQLASDGSEAVLYSFCNQANCADGAVLTSGLLLDKTGNLYGVTQLGGANAPLCDCGTVFELSADGAETVLHSFDGGDGESPSALTSDAAGNLYGTTDEGGDVERGPCCGAVFKLAPDGTETVLHAFKANPEGKDPDGIMLAAGAKGTIYGTAKEGGRYRDGTVFKIEEK